MRKKTPLAYGQRGFFLATLFDIIGSMKTISVIGLFALVTVLTFGFTWGVSDLYKIFANGYEIRTATPPQRVIIEIQIKEAQVLELKPQKLPPKRQDVDDEVI